MKKRYLLIQFAAWLANRRPAPREYSLSNPGNPIQNFSYFSIIFKDGDDFERFSIKSIKFGRGFEGIYVKKDVSFDAQNSSQSPSACLPLAYVENQKFSLMRIYGTERIIYNSIWDFLIGEVTFRARISFIREMRAQVRFERKFRFSTDRLEVIRAIYDWQFHLIEDNNSYFKMREFSSVALFTQMNTRRVWNLPKHARLLAELNFVLESLVGSGELKLSYNNQYSLTSKALQTLSQYEKASQRERLSDRTNRNILLWTVLMSCAALVQAYSAVWQIMHNTKP